MAEQERVIVGVSVSRCEYMCVRVWTCVRGNICVSVPELVKACVCVECMHVNMCRHA